MASQAGETRPQGEPWQRQRRQRRHLAGTLGGSWLQPTAPMRVLVESSTEAGPGPRFQAAKSPGRAWRPSGGCWTGKWHAKPSQACCRSHSTPRLPHGPGWRATACRAPRAGFGAAQFVHARLTSCSIASTAPFEAPGANTQRALRLRFPQAVSGCKRRMSTSTWPLQARRRPDQGWAT